MRWNALVIVQSVSWFGCAGYIRIVLEPPSRKMGFSCRINSIRSVMICMTVVTDRITIWRVVGALEELRSRDAHEKVDLRVPLLNLEMWCLVFDEPRRLALRSAPRVIWRTRESHIRQRGRRVRSALDRRDGCRKKPEQQP